MAKTPLPAPPWLANMTPAFWASLKAARAKAGANTAPGDKVLITWSDGKTYDVTAFYKA